MTTDLSSKSVEEIVRDGKDHMGSFGYWRRATNEIARRLEEAQQKIVAQQARINSLHYALGEMISEARDRSCGLRIADEAYALGNDLSALAAHDAEVAAKAKVEALEERADVYDAEPYPESEYYAIDLRAKAAEYRAKAK